MKKHEIEIRQYYGGKSHHFGDKPDCIGGKIRRKIYSDTVGNFNRLACRYNGKTYLVNSDAGDVCDPFRASDNMLSALFINIEKPCNWNL